MINEFKRAVEESCEVKKQSFDLNKEKLVEVTEEICGAVAARRKILIFGNGGSAADSQHIAAEFVVRLNADREAYPAVALTTDTSVITSCGNDFGFDNIFSRQIEALGQPGDIAIALSTSGNSENVIRGVSAAKNRDIFTVGFTGEGGGKLSGKTNVLIEVKSKNTMRIQETHMNFFHMICRAVEERMAGGKQ